MFRIFLNTTNIYKLISKSKEYGKNGQKMENISMLYVIETSGNPL
jgi:hypothetical protein